MKIALTYYVVMALLGFVVSVGLWLSGHVRARAIAGMTLGGFLAPLFVVAIVTGRVLRRRRRASRPFAPARINTAEVARALARVQADLERIDPGAASGAGRRKGSTPEP